MIVNDSFFKVLGIEFLTHGIQVAYATDSQEVLLRVAKQLFNSFGFGMSKRTLIISMDHSLGKVFLFFWKDLRIYCPTDVREVRGVGLQVTRLEAVGPGQSPKGALKLLWPLNFPSVHKIPSSSSLLQVSRKATDDSSTVP